MLKSHDTAFLNVHARNISDEYLTRPDLLKDLGIFVQIPLLAIPMMSTLNAENKRPDAYLIF